MKLYISFGTDPRHRHEIDGVVFDADCLAEIRCKDEAQGRAIAFAMFGPFWAFTYYEPRALEGVDDGTFKRGIIKL